MVFASAERFTATASAKVKPKMVACAMVATTGRLIPFEFTEVDERRVFLQIAAFAGIHATVICENGNRATDAFCIAVEILNAHFALSSPLVIASLSCVHYSVFRLDVKLFPKTAAKKGSGPYPLRSQTSLSATKNQYAS